MAEITTSVLIPRPMVACTDPKSSRYAIDGLHVCRRRFPNGNNSAWIAATDAKVAAILPTQGAIDSPTILPGELAKLSKKGPVLAERNGKWSGRTVRVLEHGEILPAKRPAEVTAEDAVGRFPRIPDVLPEATPDCIVVRLNAHALAALASVISDDGDVQLMIAPVRAGQTHGAIGVLGTVGFGAIAPLMQGTRQDGFAESESVRKYNALANEYRLDAKGV